MSNRKDNWQGMNWIRQEKRLAIYLRDGLACVYCSAGVEDGTRLDLDHVLPVAKGGSNRESNLVTACQRCNNAKSARNVAEFIKATAAYLNHGVRPIEIHKHVMDCVKRPLPMVEAKEMIAKRGSAAKVLAAVRN